MLIILLMLPRDDNERVRIFVFVSLLLDTENSIGLTGVNRQTHLNHSAYMG